MILSKEGNITDFNIRCFNVNLNADFNYNFKFYFILKLICLLIKRN